MTYTNTAASAPFAATPLAAAPLVAAPLVAALLGVIAACGAARAQSYADIIDTRNGAQPYSSLLLVEAGIIGSRPNTDQPANASRGVNDDFSWDGKIYYRDEAFGSRRGTLEAYAGRDGLFAGFTDGKLIGDDTLTRFEFRGRPWQFYRDGFYESDELRPNGFYRGSDYEGYIGFGREAQDGLYIEFGPFYKTYDFEAPDEQGLRAQIEPQGDFRLPDSFDSYGGRLYLEQRRVQMDRRRGLPQQGFVLTLIGEREWNDSSTAFGRPFFRTELPRAVWRARGRLEWYIPASDAATWEVFVHGGWHDDLDRVQNSEAQRPLGSQWADGRIRLRLHLGDSVVVTPFGVVQYSRVPDELGESNSKDFFFGGGLETYVHFGEFLSLHGWYSYVDNEQRPPIRIDEDVRGEHLFYVGMVARIGATRR